MSWPRRLLCLGLVTFAFCLAAPAAMAQEEVGEEVGESTGNPLYAYLGAAVLGSASIFVLCKSSRR
jgi:hypothetical protein